MSFLVFIVIVGIIALLVAASCIKIVPQAYAIVLERLGAYKTTWNTGIPVSYTHLDVYKRQP